MGWFSDDSDQAQAYTQFQNQDQPPHHEASFFHEALAGGAAFAAAKAWEDHEAANGQRPSHSTAKELAAAAAGAFVDREFETRGLDDIDEWRNKKQAIKDQAVQQAVPSQDDWNN